MFAQYTILFEDLLKNLKDGEEGEDPSLTEIKNLMAKIPSFNFNDDIELNFYELFKHKFDLREIGSETEGLFLHYWREKVESVLMEYVPKMLMWKDNFNSLFEFKVKLRLDNKSYQSSGDQYTYYLNPTTSSNVSKTVIKDEDGKVTTTYTGGNLKVDNLNSTDYNSNREQTIERDVLQSVWGKTRPIILEQIMDLRSIFNECLNSFETIFMGVY